MSTQDRQVEQDPARVAGAPVLAAREVGSPRLLSEFESLLNEPGCPACRHIAEETERSFFSWFQIESYSSGEMQAQLERFLARLAQLPPMPARRGRRSSTDALDALALPEGQVGRMARHHADAGLAVAAWEVQETGRKYAWAYRHEAPGPEGAGWLRALARIDGRVFEGGPAPERPPEKEPSGDDGNG